MNDSFYSLQWKHISASNNFWLIIKEGYDLNVIKESYASILRLDAEAGLNDIEYRLQETRTIRFPIETLINSTSDINMERIITI